LAWWYWLETWECAPPRGLRFESLWCQFRWAYLKERHEMEIIFVRYLGLNKNRFHKICSTIMNQKRKQTKHWIWLWLDLRHVWFIKDIRIRVLGIPGWSFDDSSLNNNNLNQRGESVIWNTQRRVSGGWFGSSSTGTFMLQVLFKWGEERVYRVQYIEDHSLFYIGWPLGFPIIPLMGHPDIYSLSPYPLIN